MRTTVVTMEIGEEDILEAIEHWLNRGVFKYTAKVAGTNLIENVEVEVEIQVPSTGEQQDDE